MLCAMFLLCGRCVLLRFNQIMLSLDLSLQMGLCGYLSIGGTALALYTVYFLCVDTLFYLGVNTWATWDSF